MSYVLEISNAAKQSVRDQRRWYREQLEDGQELAKRWTIELDKALGMLLLRPERHSLAAENGQWHPELVVRRMLFRPWKSGTGWRVLFAIDELRGVVRVLHVRHESRRWLSEEE